MIVSDRRTQKDSSMSGTFHTRLQRLLAKVRNLLRVCESAVTKKCTHTWENLHVNECVDHATLRSLSTANRLEI